MNNRYFIVLQYNGKNFHGWQTQPNAITVQQELNDKLSILLKSKVETIGAGRTDAGVHARYYVAHFDLESSINERMDILCSKLNLFISKDIAIRKIVSVAANAHARYDATSRTYKYYIATEKEVFNADLSWHVFCKLNLELMNEGAKLLMEYNDFTSFSKLHSDVKNHICSIKEAYWTRENDQLVFTITADRFLRNMVRAIVGTLVLLGRDQVTLAGLRNIIECKNRTMAGESVPACGLFLDRIDYPYPL